MGSSIFREKPLPLGGGAVNSGPVYLATTQSLAADYGSNNSPDFVVIELSVDVSKLCADMEFVKGELSIEDALAESLSNGSCFIDGDVSVAGHKAYEYEDFDEVGLITA